MDIIGMKKTLSKVTRESEEKAKRSECPICRKSQTSYCNSHVIPRLVLNNIASSGKLLHANAVMEIELLDIEKGIKNAGTFHLICNECDSRVFADYESVESLSAEPNNRVMAEIALKNTLMQLSKRYQEIELFKILQREYSMFINKEELDDIHRQDVNDYEYSFRRCKNIIDKHLKSGFHLMFYNKLPYRTPIAVQTPITVYKDLSGCIVNDIFSLSNNVRMQDLHLCVFPLEVETIIMLFFHQDDRNYTKFENQFNKLGIEDKLEFTNYLVFKYAENYFFSPLIKNEIVKNVKLRELSRNANESPEFGYFDPFELNSNYEVSPKEIPNFFKEEYKII